jgi:hypothetical protein
MVRRIIRGPPERRQVIDLVVRREVTEYRTVTGVCACGQVHRSAFPDAVGAPVQYGLGLSALAVYLTDYQNLPDGCIAELIGVLAGITLSPATLVNMGRKAAAHAWRPPWRRSVKPVCAAPWLMPVKRGCALPALCSGCMCCAPRF